MLYNTKKYNLHICCHVLLKTAPIITKTGESHAGLYNNKIIHVCVLVLLLAQIFNTTVHWQGKHVLLNTRPDWKTNGQMVRIETKTKRVDEGRALKISPLKKKVTAQEEIDLSFFSSGSLVLQHNVMRSMPENKS